MSFLLILGEKIRSSGVLDPKTGLLPTNQEFLFGEQNPSKTIENQKIEAEVEALGPLIQVMEERDIIMHRLRSFDIKVIETRISKIQASLNERGANGKL